MELIKKVEDAYRRIKFKLTHGPTTIADVIWLSKQGFEIEANVETRVQREIREYLIEGLVGLYPCDVLVAEYVFNGWENQVHIIKPYETDFIPFNPYYRMQPNENIIQNANRRMKKDILRIKNQGIIINDSYFTHDMLTRERTNQSDQSINSIAEAISAYNNGENVKVDVKVYISRTKESKEIQNIIFGATYNFILNGEGNIILKDYLINSNGMYFADEAIHIANLRLMRDIKRLHDSGLKFEYQKF